MQDFKKLGAFITIDYWKPQPLITGKIPIMKKVMELYTDVKKMKKINEMCMHLNLIFVSEIAAELYKYNIKFPPVKMSKGLKHIWKKLTEALIYKLLNQNNIWKVDNIKLWMCGDRISNGVKTYEQEAKIIFKQIQQIPINE